MVTISPVRASHTRSVVSTDVDTICAPVGENWTERTDLEWPEKVRTSVPCSTSHSLTLESHEADTIWRPSGEKATALTGLVWPWKVLRSWPE